MERLQGGIQNLIIDYTTDTNGRILGSSYNETGGFSGNLTYVYDNYGNVSDLVDDDGNIAKAVLVDPNSAEITRHHDPYDIDDPYSYRARQGFIGIEMWPGQDNRVYLQGHLVIPNDWGNVSTNGDTTTTTTDTTEKGGGDKEGNDSTSIYRPIVIGDHILIPTNAIGFDCMHDFEDGKLKDGTKNILRSIGISESELNDIEKLASACCELGKHNANKVIIGTWENGERGVLYRCHGFCSENGVGTYKDLWTTCLDSWEREP